MCSSVIGGIMVIPKLKPCMAQMDVETMKTLLSSGSLVKEVSLGGRTIDGNVQFFYALIAMACLYRPFTGRP